MPLISPIHQFGGFQQNWSPDPDMAPSQQGAAITPGVSNAKGAWTNVLGGSTSIAEQTFGIWIRFHSGATPGTMRPMLIDVGLDFETGSFTTVIPNLAACSPKNTGGSHSEATTYYFPIYLQAGRQLAMRAQVSGVDATTFRAMVCLMQKPYHIDQVQVGSYVEAIGVDTAFSDGALFSPGTNVWGAWEEIGSPTRDHWYVQPFVGFNDNTADTSGVLSQWAVSADAVLANPKQTIIPRFRSGVGSDETTWHETLPPEMCFHTIRAGQFVWVRGSQEQPNDAAHAILYCMGG